MKSFLIYKKLLFSILFLLGFFNSNAQNPFCTSDKIGIVVGVILIIFIVVLLYLLRLENKLKKLENLNKDNK